MATLFAAKGTATDPTCHRGEQQVKNISRPVRIYAVRPAGIDTDAIVAAVRDIVGHRPTAAAGLGELPARPPTFCTGCPERPVFSALKLVQRELGPTHISADIGCHSFATMPPFSMGNSILGYGMSLASAAAVGPNMAKRAIAVMGDGGFWHNGLITGVASNLFNKGDGVLIVMQNGYTSATGQQYMPSSTASRQGGGESSEPSQRKTGDKVGRNDPCPCGSGKKFKKCHGA